MSVFLTSGRSKCFKIHPFMHTFTHLRQRLPCKATASLSRAVRVRCLAQGYLETQLGGDWDGTSNLPVTSKHALPPEPKSVLTDSEVQTAGAVAGETVSHIVFA